MQNSTQPKTIPIQRPFTLLSIAGALAFACVALRAQQSAPQSSPKAGGGAASSSPSSKKTAVGREAAGAGKPKPFATPRAAADALVDAAANFDCMALAQIFGKGGADLIFTGDYGDDKARAAKFAAAATDKNSISMNPEDANMAILVVGKDDWQFPVPIMKGDAGWSFDSKIGHEELINRRIGGNELDAIAVCKGFVEAQREYAMRPHKGYDVPQYAQLMISSAGKHDGLAWQSADGTWTGPLGEKVAKAIEGGHKIGDPYHGYFFKVLKAQGPASAGGARNFVMGGAMIGGFALVAAPAEYGHSGLKTFIVNQDGIVYERDFGPATPRELANMEAFNPDASWVPVSDDDQ
jgi:Protein of unknown function (DUF2950)